MSSDKNRSRTLPRVRELKQAGNAQGVTAPGRTLPRVRELKPAMT